MAAGKIHGNEDRTSRAIISKLQFALKSKCRFFRSQDPRGRLLLTRADDCKMEESVARCLHQVRFGDLRFSHWQEIAGLFSRTSFPLRVQGSAKSYPVVVAMVSSNFADRPIKKLVLFDVDGTLTPARQAASPDMIKLLRELRKKVVIGFVGGSDLVKISEQLAVDGANAIDDFDYAFAENGLTAFKMGKPLASQSFINHVGEERYKKLVNFILHYIADMDIPIKRGTFVEFRNGMVNVSPIGRNATIAERHAFEAYDKQYGLRAEFIRILRDKFEDYGLTYSIGGKISFDIFPHGWDKTYALRHVEDEGFEEIHFFGDKTQKGGNDYEIFTDVRTVGHSVTSPDDTARILREMFFKA